MVTNMEMASAKFVPINVGPISPYLMAAAIVAGIIVALLIIRLTGQRRDKR